MALPFDDKSSGVESAFKEAREKFSGRVVNWFVNGESQFRSGTVKNVEVDQEGIKLEIESTELGDEQGSDPVKSKTKLPVERVNLGRAHEIIFKPVMVAGNRPLFTSPRGRQHQTISVDGKELHGPVLDRNLKRQINTLASAQGLFITSFASTPNGYVAKTEPLQVTSGIHNRI